MKGIPGRRFWGKLGVPLFQYISALSGVGSRHQYYPLHMDYVCRLADIYVDFVSGKAGSYRREWERMLTDANFCRFKKVFTKSVSRFGRDTVEGIQMINSLRVNGVEVIFDNENLHSFSPDFDLAFTVAVAQAVFENVDRSDNIRKGIMMQSENPDSKLYTESAMAMGMILPGNLSSLILKPK